MKIYRLVEQTVLCVSGFMVLGDMRGQIPCESMVIHKEGVRHDIDNITFYFVLLSNTLSMDKLV